MPGNTRSPGRRGLAKEHLHRERLRVAFYRVMRHQHFRRCPIEPVQHGGESTGTEMLAQTRGAAQIGEQDGDIDLGPARRKPFTANGAYIWILARGLEADQA